MRYLKPFNENNDIQDNFILCGHELLDMGFNIHRIVSDRDSVDYGNIILVKHSGHFYYEDKFGYIMLNNTIKSIIPEEVELSNKVLDIADRLLDLTGMNYYSTIFISQNTNNTMSITFSIKKWV